jgi:phosphoribosylformylglycinamidine synthase II
MIYRVDVKTRGQTDPAGEMLRRQIAGLGTSVGSVVTSRIFLIDCDADLPAIGRIAAELLADAIVETAEVLGDSPDDSGRSRIEVHLKPGVMDPVAASTEMAIRDMGYAVRQVRTGRAYLIDPVLQQAQLQQIAERLLANGVIESVHFLAYCPAQFPVPSAHGSALRRVNLRHLSDGQLLSLSREAHLFLSLTEMQAIQAYFRKQEREPTDIELETIAQTWSEHCVHKTLKSSVEVEIRDEHDQPIGSRRYENLIRQTIFDATAQLMRKSGGGDPFCLSVFKDNAGVVVFDQTDAVCFKVETHNHPSAIEPYGGSATGVGGVIRDVLGTGLAARPIANTDVFCVADPNFNGSLLRGVIHPRRILGQVVAGVRDYGNRMGIPTVNGAVYFDDRYLGNPLVFCGCVGLIPRDKIAKSARAGDAIVLIGGRTGRDGIHGATFSSAELTDTHSDEFSHAVQIGNAITQKKMADVVLAARDRGMFTAITDCGAGGLSSAVGEMGEKTGATVDLEKVPLKYAGLRYDEIWISEAQERMVLAVPPQNVGPLLQLAGGEDVEAVVIGTFGGDKLRLRYDGHEVGQLSMHFLHEGLPMHARKAVIVERQRPAPTAGPKDLTPEELRDRLLKMLAQPNIASKHWIIRQYDHEVQGGTVIKPLTGPLQIGPSDAAVIRPKLSSNRGVALGCGLAPHIQDPYEMALAAIDEAIRNVVAVGADPDRIALLDNFCWPSVDDPRTMGTLVRACEACRDAALAYRIPFISGKDSLNNQFTDRHSGQVIRIPNTLLISAMGIIPDIHRCITMDFKRAGAPVYLIAAADPGDLAGLAATHRAMARLIAQGHVAAAHDISDGGLLVAAAEMCIASGCGLKLEPDAMDANDPLVEHVGRYIIELRQSDIDLPGHFGPAAKVTRLAVVQPAPGSLIEVPISKLTAAWRGTLDW